MNMSEHVVFITQHIKFRIEELEESGVGDSSELAHKIEMCQNWVESRKSWRYSMGKLRGSDIQYMLSWAEQSQRDQRGSALFQVSGWMRGSMKGAGGWRSRRMDQGLSWRAWSIRFRAWTLFSGQWEVFGFLWVDSWHAPGKNAIPRSYEFSVLSMSLFVISFLFQAL